MQSEILAIKERVEDLEERVDKNDRAIEKIREGQSEFSKDIHEIKIHSEYTRKSLDDIKESVAMLDTHRVEEHLEKPLNKRLTREEKVLLIIIVALVVFILSSLFPNITWN